MATIRTDTRRVTDVSSEFIGLSKEIAAYANTIQSIISKLSAEVKSRGNIDAQLREMHTSLDSFAKDIQQSAVIAAQGMEQFQRAEQQNTSEIASASQGGGFTANKNYGGGMSNVKDINLDVNNIKSTNYAGSGEAGIFQKGVITGIGFAGTKAAGAGAKWLANKTGIKGGSDSAYSQANSSLYNTGGALGDNGAYSISAGDLQAKAGADYVFDPANGNIGARASAQASAVALKAQARFEGRYGSAAVGAEIGSATALASASAELMKNGSLNPTLDARTSVEVSALKGTASLEVHDGTGYSASLDAIGRVGTANAGADIKVDASKAEFAVNAGAMAAAVTGTATARGDLGPIKGGVTVTGYAGGAGAKASASFKDGTLKVGAGAALGVGGGIEFEVGLGNWAGKLDSATNGAVGDAVSAAGNAVSAALTPVNAAVGVGKSIYDSGKDFVNAVKSGDAGGAIKAVVAAPVKAAAAVGNAIYEGGKAVVNGLASAGKAVVKFFSSW